LIVTAQCSVYSLNLRVYRILRVFMSMKSFRYDACSLLNGKVGRIHTSFSGGPEFNYHLRYILF